ncbi:TonB-dependent siderophore receptor [Aliarcobacter vitoriensis]|uniref:TonB-dependent siderophore receptor n=1 Tax=Aliarcobacter vitoriensis TaxID=2011099 RepID=UPI003AAF21D5
MNFSKHSLVASSLLLLLGMNSFADEVYTIQNKTLKEALEIISKKSNLSYIANDEVLDRKSTNNIEDIEGTQQALDKLLEGSGLKAIIDDKSIVIVKEQGVVKVINGTYILDDVSVNSGKNGSAESGYLVDEISGVGLWDKRSLQDTPYQMSVISKDLIENTASEISQVFKMNPTVQVTYGPTSSRSWGSIGMNIRGFVAANNTILDGIPISGTYTTLAQDLERIEILNGLSGFLYGVGYVGGAVNYITKRPTQGRLTNLTIGSTGNQAFYGHIDLGGKIDESGKFSYRLNAFKQNGETSIKDQKVDNTLISGALDWRATDNLIFTFDASHKKSKTDKLGAAFLTSDLASKFDPKQGYAPDWTFSNISQDRLGFKSLWQVNDNIKLRTGYIYLEKEGEYSQPFINNNYNGTYDFTYYRLSPDKAKDHGVYIYTDFDFNTFGIEHTLTIGASGNKRKSYEMEGSYEWVSLGNYTLNQINNISKPTYLRDTNKPKYLSSRNEKINFMIGDDIRFNDQWSALVGLNYAKTETDNYNKSGTRTGGYDADEVTPTLSLIFKPFEDLTTYATYMESLENGQNLKNCANCIDRDKVLDPYVSKQYEVGAKYSVSENLLLSSALFRIEKANIYEKKLPNNMVDVNQDGLVIHQGIELTVTGKVTDNLTIVGGGTYLDLEIDKDTNPMLKGKKPTETASKMAKLYAEYNLPFLQGLTITGGAHYSGKSYRDGANTEILPSYTVYDAGLRYKTKIDKFPTTINLTLQNLGDKVYWSNNQQLGDPTNLAFSMKMEF